MKHIPPSLALKIGPTTALAVGIYIATIKGYNATTAVNGQTLTSACLPMVGGRVEVC